MTGPAAAGNEVSGAIGDRIAGGVLAIMAVAAWWYAATFVTGFMQPVGPGVFPRLISVPLVILSIYLLIRPGVNQRWPQHAAMLRQLALVVLLTAYAACLEPLGFLLSTLIVTVVLTRLFGANWKQALISGVLLTVALYVLFDIALGIPLPGLPGMPGY